MAEDPRRPFDIVLFTHPGFLPSPSMEKFKSMIAEGMRARGHRVEEWTASAVLHRIPLPARWRKWLGYVDQFILFPVIAKLRLLRVGEQTVFVFADQALGPWVPLVAARPHVIHVHDFLALRSAEGEFPQNPLGASGRKYQALIRWGFRHGKVFACVSARTRDDLLACIDARGREARVVYNGLNYPFARLPEPQAHALLARWLPPPGGMVLHVGGNVWYKNRAGVIRIYDAFVRRMAGSAVPPLWMVGPPPPRDVQELAANVPPAGRVEFVSDLSNEQLAAVYSLARVLLFPSVAEGFGWPIAEAMACGCLVLTTGEAPMTEVGGDAAFYLPGPPHPATADWAEAGATALRDVLELTEAEVASRRAAGLRQVERFRADDTLDAYESIYAGTLGN